MTQWVSKAVGIDLGTTNSAVAVMNPNDTATVIHQDPRSRAQTTPSCLWRASRESQPIVGRMAFARVGGNPAPVTSIKRLMGTQRTVSLAGEELTPQQVSAEILREMRRQIEQDVAAFDSAGARWMVDRAIVTVPAYFDQPQVEATREAAELAGLRVVDLLHEPTAAASYHCWKSGVRDGTFLVYDLGGGTFDVSVVRCKAGDFRVLGISGNPMLGGDDIDAALTHRLLERLREDGWALDLDVENDPEDGLRFRRLRLLAEGAKKALSDRTEYMLRDTGTVLDKQGNPVLIDTLVERAELEDTVRPLIERTFDYCDEALRHAQREANVTLADVDGVILAGGSTHLPLVRELVTSRLCAGAKCDEPVYEQVDTVVALGAAIRAATVGGVELYDQDRTVRVALRGTGVTTKKSTTVGGTVTALAPGLDLTDGSVRLLIDGYEDNAEVNTEGHFAFSGVELTPEAQSLLTLQVFDAAGAPRAQVGRPVVHDPNAGPSGSTVGSAVCAKAIFLDVERAGRKEKDELIPAMQSLPYKARFTYGHPGNTESLVFQLYQGAREIKTIIAPVPSSLTAGTPINLDIAIDTTLLISVQGTIDDTTFDGIVGIAPDRALPTEAEVDELRRSFEDASVFLSAGERSVSQARMTTARDGYEQARTSGDTARAVHEFGLMEEIVGQMSRRDPDLEPPKEKFDKLVAECLNLNSYLGECSTELEVPHDAAEMARSITTQRDQGESAYTTRDQRSYAETVRQLDSYRKHLQSQADGQTRRKLGDLSPHQRAGIALRAAENEAEETRLRVSVSGTPSQRAEFEGILQRLAAMPARINQDPDGVHQEAVSELRRLEQLSRALVDRPGGGPALPRAF
ncbi:Hsp70 family protein [Streptomyces mayteni]